MAIPQNFSNVILISYGIFALVTVTPRVLSSKASVFVTIHHHCLNPYQELIP